MFTKPKFNLHSLDPLLKLEKDTLKGGIKLTTSWCIVTFSNTSDTQLIRGRMAVVDVES